MRMFWVVSPVALPAVFALNSAYPAKLLWQLSSQSTRLELLRYRFESRPTQLSHCAALDEHVCMLLSCTCTYSCSFVSFLLIIRFPVSKCSFPSVLLFTSHPLCNPFLLCSHLVLTSVSLPVSSSRCWLPVRGWWSIWQRRGRGEELKGCSEFVVISLTLTSPSSLSKFWNMWALHTSLCVIW